MHLPDCGVPDVGLTPAQEVFVVALQHEKRSVSVGDGVHHHTAGVGLFQGPRSGCRHSVVSFLCTTIMTTGGFSEHAAQERKSFLDGRLAGAL